MKIKLSVVLDAIEMADDFMYFLDLQTGGIVCFADEFKIDLDEEELEYEMEENPERYLRLPTKFEIHEYHIIEEFIWSLPEGGKQNQLERAIRGRGAFRRFKDLLYDFDLEEEWFQYEADTYLKMAIEWCENNGIEYEE